MFIFLLSLYPIEKHISKHKTFFLIKKKKRHFYIQNFIFKKINYFQENFLIKLLINLFNKQTKLTNFKHINEILIKNYSTYENKHIFRN